jgi:hypothetical protein
MQVKVSHPASGKEQTVEWNAPKDLDDAVRMYGKEVVFNQAVAALRVAIQGIVRNAMGGDEPKSPKQIQDLVTNYKPGIRVRGKSPQEKIAETYAKMSKEEKAALIKRLSTGA